MTTYTKKFKEFIPEWNPESDDYIVGYRNLDDSEIRIPLLAVDNSITANKYIRKDIDDYANGIIRFNKGFTVSNKVMSTIYLQGLDGWMGTQKGDFEMNSLILREFLEVPELRKNKITVMGNQFWFTDSAMVKVANATGSDNYDIYFKLEDEEYAPFELNDIIKGIYHYDNGFWTVYLKVYELIVNPDTGGEIGVKAHSMNGRDPRQSMLLARMNNSDNPERQGSIFADGLRKYIRVLDGYNPDDPTSEGSIKTLKVQIGDLSTITNHPIFGDLEGYGLYADNVYLTGKLIVKNDPNQPGQELGVYRGVWNNQANYYKYDQVTYKGSLFTSKQIDNIGHIPTGSVDDLWWELTVAKGEDGTSAESNIIIELTNDNHNIPTDSEGKNPSYGGAYCTAYVFQGTNDITELYTISATVEAPVTSQQLQIVQNDNTVTITHISDDIDAAAIKFTATAVGYPTVTRTWNVAKVKSGTPGEPATAYWIVTDSPVIKKYVFNINDSEVIRYEPSPFVVRAFAQTGQENIRQFDGYFRIKYGTQVNIIAGSVYQFTPQADVDNYTIEFFLEQGLYTLLDKEIITVVEDGRDGDTPDWNIFIFKKGPEQPSAPTFTTPPSSYPSDGWYDYPTSDGIWWMSTAVVNGNSKTIASWSVPVKTTGEDGLNGADGVDGADGKSIMWKGTFTSHPSNPENGWAYYNSIDKKSYVYQSGSWYQMTVDGVDGANGPQGVPGEPGKDGKVYFTWIRYADTSTGGGISNDPTGKAYIGFAYNKETPTESNTPGDYIWSLIKGDKGDTGVAGTPGEDGTTYYTWIKYSDNADGTGLYDIPNANTKYIGIAVNKTVATESSVKTDYTWSQFKGDTGATGPQGVAGAPGADGITYYTWIRYADTVTGEGISNDPTGKLFIGFAYNKTTSTESNVPGDYKWSRYHGEDGTDGIPGTPGADGKTYYTWIAYSDYANGKDMYQVPNENTKYIGIAVNKLTKIESTSPTDYTWSKFKGEPGENGLDIIWKGELKNPPTSPQLNWVYKDTDNGIVYIWNGTAWALMVADGSDGTNGTNGSNGLSVFITYHDNDIYNKPATPTGNGTVAGWHTTPTSSCVWMSQKVSSTATSGTWGAPIQLRGENGGYVDFKYAVSTSHNTPPSIVKTDRQPAGWSDVPPTVTSGLFLWMVNAFINPDNTLNGVWSDPMRISGETGPEGPRGPQGLHGNDGLQGPSIAFGGNWSDTTQYYGYTDTQTCVYYGGKYYYTKTVSPDLSPLTIPPGAANNPASANGKVYWNEFVGQFDNIATGLLLAERIATSELTANKLFIVDRQESTGNIIAADGSIITKEEEKNLDPNQIIGRLTKGWYLDQGVIRSIAVNSDNTPKLILDKDGKITATGVNVTGTVHFENGTIGSLQVFNDSAWTATVNGPYPASSGFYYLRKNQGVTITPQGHIIGKDYFLTGDSTVGPSVFIGDVYVPGSSVPGTDDSTLTSFLKLFNSLFERVLVNSQYHIKAKLPLFSVGEITAYGDDNMDIPSIWDGIPVDKVTIDLVNGKLTVIGGTGGIKGISLPSMTAEDALVGASLNAAGDVITFTKGTFATKAYVTWGNITNKPSTFTPSSHTHIISNITGLQTALNSKLETSIFNTHNNDNTRHITGAERTKWNGVVTDFAGLEIGGRNLFLNSDFSRGFDYYWEKMNSSPSSNFEVIGSTLRVTYVEGFNTDFGKINFVSLNDLSSTEHIVISAIIKGNGGLKIRFGSRQNPVIHINNDEYKKFTQIIPKSEFGNGNLIFEVSSGELFFDKLKVEKGTIPTDWTPAPEDQVSDWNTTDVNSFSFIKNKPTSLSQFTDNIGVATHIANKANPHSVTKAQIGLGNVDNTADSAKNVLSATKLQTARTIAGVSFDGTDNISIPFTNLSSKPTTISGYGITDAYTKSQINGFLALKLDASTFNDLFEKVNIGTTASPVYAIKAKYNFYSVGEVSAFGEGAGSGGSGLIQTVYGYSGLGGTYNNATLTDTFNAYTINKINTDLGARITSLEAGSALNFATAGSGNVVTSITKSGTSVSVVKGLTAVLEGDTRLTNSRPNPYALTFSGYSTATYNGSAAVSVTLPTKLSQLTNDSGYLTSIDADLVAIAALTGTSGLLRKTAANTWSLDTNAYLTAITKAQVEAVLTGNITTHTHSQYITGNQTITVSGDAKGSGTTSIALTLANSGVVAGTYNNSATQVRPFTVDSKGRITSIGTAVTITPAWGSITGHPTTISGYGITDATPLPIFFTHNNDNTRHITGAERTKWDGVVTDFAGLEIGGRNYFSLNEFQSLSPESWVVDAYVYRFNLEPNTEYTVSSNVPEQSGTENTNIYFNDSGTSNSGVWKGRPVTKNSGETGELYIAIPTGRWQTNNLRNGVYWVQLEKGDKATDWTPAPEDQVSDWLTTDVNSFSFIKNKPTTVSGYGITDAYTKAQVDTSLNGKVSKTGDTMSGYLTLTSGKLELNQSTQTPWPNSTNSDSNNYIKLARQSINILNNGLHFFGDGTENSRRFGIQSGHQSAVYASAVGTLELNPFGGTVRVGPGGLYSSGGVTAKSIIANDGRFNKNLAYYDAGTSSVTGTICITLPNSWNKGMNIYEIHMYEYSTNTHSVIRVSGYNYDGSPGWYNTGYEVKGGYNKSVRLSHNGSKNVILLGNTTTVWSYPQVFLNSVLTGWANPTSWSSGYGISIITSETGFNHTVNAALSKESFGEIYTSGNITASNFMLNDVSTNPYLKLTHNNVNWYIQGYTGYLYLGAGVSGNSMRIDSSGNVNVYNTLTSSGTVTAPNLSFGNNSQIRTNSGYLELVSNGDEICVGGTTSTMYVNYRPASNGAPTNWIWRAGSSTSFANFYIGNLNATGNITASGEVTAYSDIRLKSNIDTLPYRGRLSPKTYIKDGKQSIGFIAQEVQELYPELVLVGGDDNHYLSLNYGSITSVLSAQVNTIEDEVTILKNKIKDLEYEITILKNK